MPEIDARAWANHLMSEVYREESWAMGLGFDSAHEYHLELDEHFEHIQTYEEWDRKA